MRDRDRLNAYETEGRDNLYVIDDNTPTADIVEALENCMSGLNHEDEAYRKAIKQAIRRLTPKGR